MRAKAEAQRQKRSEEVVILSKKIRRNLCCDQGGKNAEVASHIKEPLVNKDIAGVYNKRFTTN